MSGRILVIRGGAIGDFILTLPAIRLIREGFPDSHLEIMGYDRVLKLVNGRFYADAVRSIEYGPLAGFFNPKGELDAGLSEYFASFQQVVSYIYDPDELFAQSLRKSGVKNLISGDPRVQESRHAAEHLAQPLEALALFLDSPAAQIHPSEEDVREAEKLTEKFPPGWIAVHPGSGSPKKNWDLEHWTALIVALQKDGRRVVIVGGESDQERLEALRGRFGHTVSWLTHQPLHVLAAALAKSRLFIGHDSGISHLAAASGARCVLLYGPTNPEVWAPRNEGVKIVMAPGGNFSHLSPETVLEVARPELDHE